MLDNKTDVMIHKFMDMLDHSYEYKTSNERNKIERKIRDIAESAVKNLNIPAVIKSVCDDCTAYPFDERGKTPLCKTCKKNPSQTVL